MVMDLERKIRITQVNHNTIIRWVRKAGNQLPDESNNYEIPQVAQKG